MTKNADQAVSLIDTATSLVATTVVVGEYPIAVAASPDGSRVHVTNRDDGTVWPSTRRP